MKNLKSLLLSLLIITVVFTSCTNNEPLFEEQNTTESVAITTTLSELSLQFNSEGNVIPSENPAGNIVFDFCFDFVYPITLSYNNGSTVDVNDLDGLIDVMINSTQELYINGIGFPFQVETYVDSSDSIQIVTINNEEEFINLLENCDFDAFDCECFEDYNPVCVEIYDPNGTSFVVTYPNACYAECDSFTEADFVENCETDYNTNAGNECFTFNFPISFIIDNGTTITVNSEMELGTALYNVYYFEFVYPFDVTLESGEVVTVNNELEYFTILDDCYGSYNGNDCECGEIFEPICVQVTNPMGGVEIFVFPNACFALCEGFTEADFVTCDDINFGDCTEEEYISNLTQCNHYAFFLNNNDATAYEVQFSADGTLTIISEDQTFTTTGTWEFGTSTPDGTITIIIDAEDNNFDDIWGITGCETEFVYMFSTTQSFVIEVICN